MSEMTKSLIARRREQRQAPAWKLERLGWTQTDIAVVSNIAQSNVHEDISKLSEITKQIIALRNEGHLVETVIERFGAIGIPPLIVWAALLDGHDDHKVLPVLAFAGWGGRPWSP